MVSRIRLALQLLLAMLALAASPVLADQANTIHASPDEGNGTTSCTSLNDDLSQATRYLSGTVIYLQGSNPDNTITYTFDTNFYDEISVLSRGAGYVDASVVVTYVIYKYNSGTGAQTVLDSRNGGAVVIPASGMTQGMLGAGNLTINPAAEGIRYKVKHGSSGAWTGDL